MFDKFIVISVGDERSSFIENIVSAVGKDKQVKGVEFVDARRNDIDAFSMLHALGVSTDVYAPDDGRTMPMKKTEAGIFCSYILALEQGMVRSRGNFLIFEDDALLTENFTSRLQDMVNDLPHDFDFLSLYSLAGQDVFTDQSNIGSSLIHKCIHQYAMNVGILWSPIGIKKILSIFRSRGATYNSDSVIYRASREGLLNGFIIRPDADPLIVHGTVPSLIDPSNERRV